MKTLVSCAFLIAGAWAAEPAVIVIRAGTIHDGKGGTLRNQDVTVRGGKIEALEKSRQRQSGQIPTMFLQWSFVEVRAHVLGKRRIRK